MDITVMATKTNTTRRDTSMIGRMCEKEMRSPRVDLKFVEWGWLRS
jgi:hypothetical protein